ncbi:MAG: hypothetical protein WCK15_06170 [Pirellula sp.]
MLSIPMLLCRCVLAICFQQSPDTTQAEILSNDALESVAGAADLGESLNSQELNSKKVLNDDTPEWVKNGIVLGEDHSLAISSSLLPDLEQCREDLKTSMMRDVQAYLNNHVLENASALLLPQLTQEYVDKYWVVASQTFDNVQDRPSGTYHQLWIGLHISADQLKKVREWERHRVRESRTKQVGVLGGAGVAAITILSGFVGVLARREKAKLKA